MIIFVFFSVVLWWCYLYDSNPPVLDLVMSSKYHLLRLFGMDSVWAMHCQTNQLSYQVLFVRLWENLLWFFNTTNRSLFSYPSPSPQIVMSAPQYMPGRCFWFPSLLFHGPTEPWSAIRLLQITIGKFTLNCNRPLTDTQELEEQTSATSCICPIVRVIHRESRDSSKWSSIT